MNVEMTLGKMLVQCVFVSGMPSAVERYEQVQFGKGTSACNLVPQEGLNYLLFIIMDRIMKP